MKAIWKGEVLADSNETLVVERNHYFPVSSLNMTLFEPSETTSFCPWKGEANYYSINVNGEINKDAAWYYQSPKEAAKQIAGRVAFWKGVEVVPD